MKSAVKHNDYRADIDGLRAVAILSVLGFHAFPTAFPSGFIGVDIFFVISGFLISSIILKELTTDRFSFIHFYSRRIKRIFPALLLVMSCSFVIGWFVLLPDELKQLGKHIAAGAGFGSNFVLLNENGYFDNLSDSKPLLHLWSLGVEEQFYLIWPFILYVTWKFKKSFLAVICITLATLTISFLLNVVRIHDHSVSVFYMPQTRFWELLVGAVLASFTFRKAAFLSRFIAQDQTRQGVLSNALSLCGATLLVLCYFLLTKDKRFPGWWALLPTLGASMVIHAGSQAWLNRKLLSNRILVWFGLISFPLYLWHWPLLSFARIMQGETPSLEIRIVVITLSITLAWFTFVMIEKPIRFGQMLKLNTNYISNTLILLMLVVGFIGYNAYSRDGYRFRAGIKKFDQQNNGFNWNEIDKYMKVAASASPELKRDVVLIGDSHAQAIFGGFSELFKKHQTNLQLKAGTACPPFYDLTVQHIGHPEECKDVMNGYLDAAIKDESIKTVMLTSRGPLYLTGSGFGDIDLIHLMIKSTYANAKPNEDYTDVFEDAMSRTLKMLTAANKKIIYIVDAPELGFAPEQCVDTRPYKLVENTKASCGIAKSIYLQRNASYLKIVAKQAAFYPNVKFLYPAHLLCDDTFCYAKKEGIVFYRDDDHLSYQGSLKLGQLLENEIFQ